MSAPRTVLVTSSVQLKECAGKLAEGTQYFLDTEFDFAGPAKKLCLVQVWTGSGDIYLIDTVTLTALDPLAGAISRPGVEWIVHAGDQDVALLREALHLAACPRVFDT